MGGRVFYKGEMLEGAPDLWQQPELRQKNKRSFFFSFPPHTMLNTITTFHGDIVWCVWLPFCFAFSLLFGSFAGEMKHILQVG